MAGETILLIEDESAIADTVLYALETEGFRVQWVSLGADGISALQNYPSIAVVILDVGLPDTNGFEVCRAIRRFSEVPIIFLTARNEEVDRIVGLEIGADDYVTKPFSPRELAARVKVILRRLQAVPSAAVAADNGFTLDEARARIAYCGQWLTLTRFEYLILKLLLSQPERVFSRAQIMDRVWPEPEASLERVVDTHIKSLRGKLRAVHGDEEPITTHRGLGYSISGPCREA